MLNFEWFEPGVVRIFYKFYAYPVADNDRFFRAHMYHMVRMFIANMCECPFLIWNELRWVDRFNNHQNGTQLWYSFDLDGFDPVTHYKEHAHLYGRGGYKRSRRCVPSRVSSSWRSIFRARLAGGRNWRGLGA